MPFPTALTNAHASEQQLSRANLDALGFAVSHDERNPFAERRYKTHELCDRAIDRASPAPRSYRGECHWDLRKARCGHAHVNAHANTYANIPVHTHVHAHVCTHTCLHAYLHKSSHTCLRTCLHLCPYTCLNKYSHTCLHTCLHQCLQKVPGIDGKRWKAILNQNASLSAWGPFGRNQHIMTLLRRESQHRGSEL